MRARYRTWTKGSENEEEPRKEQVGWAGKAGFSTTEAGGASALGRWQRGWGHHLSGLLPGPCLRGPSPCSRAAACRTCLSPQPPTSPLSSASLSPCGEVDELAAQGADGDARATSSTAGGGWEAAEGGSLAPAAGKGLGRAKGYTGSKWRLEGLRAPTPVPRAPLGPAPRPGPGPITASQARM